MANKMIIILGAGESGVGAAVLAKKQGFEVFVSDFSNIKSEYIKTLQNNNISFEQKTHNKVIELIDGKHHINTAKDFFNIEVIKSPGIADNVPIIKKIKEKQIPIISEIEFAARYTSAKKICITGSNGKTTTTMLIYHILKNAGLNVGLAGNVGKSFALQVAEENFDYYVLELSSFQLDGMYDFKADIAIITNITPDHLDRYDYIFQNYINSKFRILQNQTENDYFIFWGNDKVILNEIEKRKIKAKMLPFGLEQRAKNKEQRQNFAFTENDQLIFKQIVLQAIAGQARNDSEKQPPTNKSTNQQTFMTMELENIAAKGVHNLYNSMAAGLVGQICNIDKDTIRQSLETFEGVEHRMEYVATVRGVRYINDSKATNVNSCWYALQSMKTPVVLILGGTDKGNDYSEIADLVNEKVHTLIFLGVDNEKLKSFFSEKKPNGQPKIPYIEVRSMQECVNEAYKAAKDGDTVLLSPCCASFDLFENYEDRGQQFKECVKKL